MQKKLKAGEKIIFGIPYFESYLYHHAKIIEVKNETLVVRYSSNTETLKGFEKINHTTEIPESFIVKN